MCGQRGLSSAVLLLGMVSMSEESPHLVTVSRWFFTTMVASGFVGSEPGWMSDTSNSKGWKNCPGSKKHSYCHLQGKSPSHQQRLHGHWLAGIDAKADWVLCAGPGVTGTICHVAFPLCHVSPTNLKLEHSIPSSPCVCADIR